MDDVKDTIMTLPYTNYKGETKIRRVVPVNVKYEDNKYHGKTWILVCFDVDKQEIREYDLVQMINGAYEIGLMDGQQLQMENFEYMSIEDGQSFVELYKLGE